MAWIRTILLRSTFYLSILVSMSVFSSMTRTFTHVVRVSVLFPRMTFIKVSSSLVFCQTRILRRFSLFRSEKYIMWPMIWDRTAWIAFTQTLVPLKAWTVWKFWQKFVSRTKTVRISSLSCTFLNRTLCF